MSKHAHETDVAFIEALAELLRRNDLTEIEVFREYGEDDSLNVRVARQAPIPTMQPAGAPVSAAPAVPQPAPNPAPTPAAPPAVEDPALHPGAVTSPMVGTAYLQPEPDTPAFVKLGDTVEAGQTLLIIEAMKTMNQIPSPRSGTVKRILVEDGTPVEYGAPLMIVE